ncbi:MAG: aminoacyl-tRNA hydrolase [Spirochaetales bacterium]|nr:aminoacyl-tRNA hydrolase [Spirochaetales bacterium]
MLNYIVIGLGNPGPKYYDTRHNVGFRVLDLLQNRTGRKLKKAFFRPFLYSESKINENKLILIKPLTYMNRSGDVLPAVLKRWPDEDRTIVILCDNMDLKPGELRIKQKGSSAGHNGIKSILEYLKTDDFLRFYLGVGRPDKGVTVVEHVLGSSDLHNKEIRTAEENACDAVFSLIENPVSRVMNEFNRKQT